MTQTTDNSGTGVILGILITVLLVVGGYFFLKSNGDIGNKTTTTNIEMPDVKIDAPDMPAPSKD